MRSDSRTFSVIGLGKLGSPMVACFASRGFNVIGVDVDPEKVALVDAGKAPVFEPSLDEMLASSADRISATTDYRRAVMDSEITFVIVPTPSEPDGGFSLCYTLPACEAIGKALADKDEYHLVVLTSTVLPGATQNIVRQTLELASGKRCGTDFGLCYSPEFIALGSVIRNFLNPDFVLVGESDEKSGAILESVYKQVCLNDPPVARMNFVNAEIAKLSVNTYVTTKITFANMLARICEKLDGADVDVVTSALGMDTRIGRKYLTGAVGYGGPCFPRDNVALSMLARSLDVPATLAEAVDKSNRAEADRLAGIVKSVLPSGGTVGVLGLSYKPDTDVIEESQSIYLIKALLEDDIFVVAHDPAATDNARNALGGSVRFANSPDEVASIADVIVIATPWQEFKSLDTKLLARQGGRPTIVDCWRMLDSNSIAGVADYVGIGLGNTSACKSAVASANTKSVCACRASLIGGNG